MAIELNNSYKPGLLAQKQAEKISQIILKNELKEKNTGYIKKNRKFFLAAKNKLGLEILLCDDRRIKKLNFRFKKRKTATDVLSFQILDEDTLGSIAISVDTAGKQAKIFKHSLKKEIVILLIHGLLHILGYIHSHTMRKKEKFYLNFFSKILSLS